MNDRPERPTPDLEDVLDAFVAADEDRGLNGGPGDLLADWIERYPRYARELTEYAAASAIVQALPPSPRAGEIDESALIQRGMRVVQRIRSRVAPPSAANTAPFTGLLEAARANGLSPSQLAAAVGLGAVTLRKLDRRLIRFASIPRQAIEALAAATHTDAARVADYLRQGPTFAAATEHRAEQAPRLAEQDFFTAIQSDPGLNAKQRARWLALRPQDQ